MVSQAARALLSEAPVPGEPGQVRVTLQLVCGCTVERNIAADRIIATVEGKRLAVGKYPCPLDHPARPPG